VRESRPINDTRENTMDGEWAAVAKFGKQPIKNPAIGMSDRVQTLRRGMVGSLHAGMLPPEQRRMQGQTLSHAAEKGLTPRAGSSPVLMRVSEFARQLPERAMDAMRQVHGRWGPSLGR
jgi:hypothetical protein